ncbi:MAG: glycosyltransferase family 1 protein, partial [Patescibacteria group bacterium]
HVIPSPSSFFIPSERSESRDLIPIPPLPIVTRRLPNKLLNLSLLATGHPYLDQWAGDADIWIAPNLNFTSISPRCKLIQVVHDVSFLVDPSWYSLKSRMWHRAIRVQNVLNRADAIVAISQATAADLARYFPKVAHKIKIIYPGTPTAPIVTPEYQQTIRKKYHLPARFFLYVGALEPRKNIPALLDAFAHFTHTTAYPHELILAGPNNSPLPRGERARVRVLGSVSTKTKHALMSLAEALVFPSLYEGFGFPPLEAMSHGTPVIASWSTSLPEVVGDAGLLVSPYKPHEIAHAMRMIADHADLRDDLSRRALAQAKKFTWEKTAKEFLKLCTSR